MVKDNPCPCMVLSESDSKLCTTFEFGLKKNNHIHFKKRIDYKAKQFMMTKIIPRKSLHVIEDRACGVQVCDYEQAIALNLFKI
jgi:hypothetical protein